MFEMTIVLYRMSELVMSVFTQLGKELHFKLKIPQARGIPKRYANVSGRI